MFARFRNFIALIKRQSRKIFASLGLSALITILCYLMNNCPYPYWDSLDKFTWMEYFLSNIKPDSTDTSDALFINISHDKQIVDVNFVRHLGDPGYKGEDYTFRSDTFGLHGTIDITNRETLLKFLKKAEKADTYKYICLDIRFENGIKTKTDSLLLNVQIPRMRDVAYSTHSDIEDHEMADHNKHHT